MLKVWATDHIRYTAQGLPVWGHRFFTEGTRMTHTRPHPIHSKQARAQAQAERAFTKENLKKELKRANGEIGKFKKLDGGATKKWGSRGQSVNKLVGKFIFPQLINAIACDCPRFARGKIPAFEASGGILWN